MCKCIGDETVQVACTRITRSRTQRSPVRQADQAYSSFDTFEEQSNRSDYNFKLEEIEEDTHNVSHDLLACYLSTLISEFGLSSILSNHLIRVIRSLVDVRSVRAMRHEERKRRHEAALEGGSGRISMKGGQFRRYRTTWFSLRF
jgi:hypothetical protein